MEEVFRLRRKYPSYEAAQETFRQECPPPMAAFGNRVDKGEAVRRHVSTADIRQMTSETVETLMSDNIVM